LRTSLNSIDRDHPSPINLHNGTIYEYPHFIYDFQKLSS
jgi:hypothetical protein